MLDIDEISKNDFFKFYNGYVKEEKTKGRFNGGDFYNMQLYRIGNRFANLIYTAVKEGKMLYRDAYMLTGLYGDTFNRFIEKQNSKCKKNGRYCTFLL